MKARFKTTSIITQGYHTMHYKRKGHRGRSKKQGTKNQTGRCHGNSESKAIYYGGTYKNIHRSASQRNKVEKSETEWDDAR